MSPLAEDIYTSAPLRFIVDGKSLYIHGQLVSRHSKPLSAKIKARNDFTIIDSVDKDTFARFIEWAYKGYYTAAEYWIDAGSPSLSKFEDSDTCTPETEPPLPCVDEAPAPTEEPEPELKLDDGWGSFCPKKSKKSGKKTKMLADEPPPDVSAPEEPAPEPELKLDDSWGGFGTKKCKGTGKKTKVVWDEPPPEEPAPEPEVKLDDCWGSFGSKKCMRTKGGIWTWNVPAAVEPAQVPAPPEECPPEPQPKKSSKESLKESFHALKYETSQQTITIPSPRPNQDPNENYTPIFLSHAHLYVFARRYDIPPLQTLALSNIHMTLEKFTLHPERAGDIIELLEYIYSSRELKEGGFEEMREMLKGYIGFEMDVLMKDGAFRGLLKEEGELLDDFVEMVGRRI